MTQGKTRQASWVLSHPPRCHLAQVTPYQTDEVVIILPVNHPLAGRAALDVDQLYSLQFVSLHKSTTVQGIRAVLEAYSICWTGLKVVMVGLQRCPCCTGLLSALGCDLGTRAPCMPLTAPAPSGL